MNTLQNEFQLDLARRRISDLEGQLEVAQMAIGVLNADFTIVAQRVLALAGPPGWTVAEYNSWVDAVNDACTDRRLWQVPTTQCLKYEVVVEVDHYTADSAEVVKEIIEGDVAMESDNGHIINITATLVES